MSRSDRGLLSLRSGEGDRAAGVVMPVSITHGIAVSWNMKTENGNDQREA